MEKSTLTGLYYNESDMVYFRNTLQSAFYVFQGVELQDLFVDDKMHFVFVFLKEDHKKILPLWLNANIERNKVNNNEQE